MKQHLCTVHCTVVKNFCFEFVCLFVCLYYGRAPNKDTRHIPRVLFLYEWHFTNHVCNRQMWKKVQQSAIIYNIQAFLNFCAFDFRNFGFNAAYNSILFSYNLVLQWIFDLRKFLGTAKNFLKSKIFLKSNTPSSLKYVIWKYFYDPIY